MGECGLVTGAPLGSLAFEADATLTRRRGVARRAANGLSADELLELRIPGEAPCDDGIRQHAAGRIPVEDAGLGDDTQFVLVLDDVAADNPESSGPADDRPDGLVGMALEAVRNQVVEELGVAFLVGGDPADELGERPYKSPTSVQGQPAP